MLQLRSIAESLESLPTIVEVGTHTPDLVPTPPTTEF
jgi:hypothetical protein